MRNAAAGDHREALRYLLARRGAAFQRTHRVIAGLEDRGRVHDAAVAEAVRAHNPDAPASWPFRPPDRITVPTPFVMRIGLIT